MAHCKHWHNGVCKDCRKNCPIKKKLAAKAAKKAERLARETELAAAGGPGGAVDVSTEVLRLASAAAGEKKKKQNSAATGGDKGSLSVPAAAPLPDDGTTAELREDSLLEALVHGKRVAGFARELFRATQALHGLERGVDRGAAKGLEPGDQYLHATRFLSGWVRNVTVGTER